MSGCCWKREERPGYCEEAVGPAVGEERDCVTQGLVALHKDAQTRGHWGQCLSGPDDQAASWSPYNPDSVPMPQGGRESVIPYIP